MDQKAKVLVGLEGDARLLGKFIKQAIPEGAGFALLLFEFEGDAMTWVSNANRADMVIALKELIVRLETGTTAPHGQPFHPANRPGKG